MGMDCYVYVGPFVKPPVVDVVESRKVYGCANGHTTRNTKEKFCSECGSPLIYQTQQKQVTRILRLYDVKGNFEDEVHEHSFSDKEAVWMPNHHGIGHSFSDGDEGIFGLDAEELAHSCTKYKERYASLLQAVKEQFGIELPIMFGAVTYYA